MTFDVVHDDDHEDLLGVLAAKATQYLEEDDVDVWSTTTSWEPDGPDRAPVE